MNTAPTQVKQANALDTIDAMLQSIGSTKVGESNTEAGGFQGETEHPVKKEDDRTEDAYEGSRAAENEADVTEEQSPNEVVGETDVNKESGAEKAALGLGDAVDQDAVQLNIGTLQKATGEDPASETQKAKGGKDDSDDGDGGSQNRGKSTHPARTNNEEIDGHKWSNAIGELLGQVKTASDLGTEAIAAISVDADSEVQAKVASMQKESMCGECHHDPCDCSDEKKAAAKAAVEKTAAEKTAAEKAGASLANAVSAEGQVPDTDKQAQDRQVVEDLSTTITTAYAMADKTAAYLAGLREKQGMPGEEEEEERGGDPGTNPPAPEEESGAPPEEMGGGPPGMGGMEGDPMGGGGGGDEEALLQALTGGGGGMEGGGDPMGGGMPGMEEMGGGGMPGMGGGPEMGGGGGMPGMGGGGMPGMGGGPEMGGGMPGMGGDPMMSGGGGGGEIGEEQLAMLAAALDEAGITPEQLEMAATQKAAYSLKKAASAVERTSKWRPKTAAEASRYQSILNHVREVCATSS